MECRIPNAIDSIRRRRGTMLRRRGGVDDPSRRWCEGSFVCRCDPDRRGVASIAPGPSLDRGTQSRADDAGVDGCAGTDVPPPPTPPPRGLATHSPGLTIFFDLWNVLPILSASLKMLLPPPLLPPLAALPLISCQLSLPTSSVSELDSE